MLINKSDLRSDQVGSEIEGKVLDDANVSLIFVDAPPGAGPRLHSHPYKEIFILHEGQATFTVGDKLIEAIAGQIIVAPASVAHKFVNSGAGLLRQTDIHLSPVFITKWLE